MLRALCSPILCRRVSHQFALHSRRWAMPSVMRPQPVIQHTRKYSSVSDGTLKWTATAATQQGEDGDSMPSLTNPLHKAVVKKETSVQDIQKIIAQGTPVDALDTGFTALWLAACCGNVELVRELVRLGADIHKPAGHNVSPIFAAVIYNHLDVFKELIKLGADIYQRTENGQGILHVAPIHWIETLVKLGADINVSPNDGLTPLHVAAQTKNTTLVECLLQHGADVNAPGRLKATPLYCAAQAGSYGVVKALIQQEGIDLETECPLTPLHIAASGGNLTAVQLLLRAGAKVDARVPTTATTEKGQTPLHYAAKAGFVDVVAALLEAGAELNAKDENEVTPLRMAITNGHSNVASLLIEQAEDKLKLELSEILIEAVRSENIQAIKILIAAGANVEGGVYPDIPSELHGLRDIAVKSKRDLQFEMALYHYGIPLSKGLRFTPLLESCARGTFPVTKALVSLGANVNARDVLGFTGLHAAFYTQDNLEIAEILLAGGLDINVKTPRGETALHVAVQRGNPQAIKFLLAKGIDKHARVEGKTALDMAVLYKNTSIVELLQ